MRQWIVGEGVAFVSRPPVLAQIGRSKRHHPTQPRNYGQLGRTAADMGKMDQEVLHRSLAGTPPLGPRELVL
jgi:hypothetical protein